MNHDMIMEAEQAVIGACIANPQLIAEISTRITDADFSTATHQDLFRSANELFNDQKPVDIVSLGEHLTAKKRPFNASYALELIDHGSVMSTNAIYHADLVKQFARRRSLQSTLVHYANLAANGDPDQVLAQVQSALGMMTGDVETITTLYDEKKKALIWIEEALKHDGDFLGLSTGLKSLDNRWQGMRKGQMIIVAGRPGMGKTVVVMNIANHVAKQQGGTVLVFNFEMQKLALSLRDMANSANVQLQHLLSPKKANESTWANLGAGGIHENDKNTLLDKSSGIGIDMLMARARNQHRQTPLSLVVVDHMHLVGGNPAYDPVRQMTEISGKLKSLALELDCPVLVAAQLNRAADGRASKRPAMSDLRQSGSIEQDADIIAMLYRDDVYDKDSQDAGIMEIETVKLRDGEAGLDRFSAQMGKSKIMELASEYQPKEAEYSL